MLQPPGSGSGRRTSAPTTSNRRKTPESPDDAIRALQRLPPNKRCCDCKSKLPSCCNLTVGSFVCITCAGIHRELNQRVKGVGHSSFTQEEADFMKQTDNDQVNAVYLARYNPTAERMKEPKDNSDPQHCKAWINRKYKDKFWHGGSGGGVSQKQHGQPTVAQVPPKPEQDLLGGFSSSTSNASGSKNQGWDAFGGSSQTKSQQPSSQQPAFQPDFGNFSQQQQSSNHDFPADFGSSQTKQQFQQQQQQQQAQPPPPQQATFQPNFASFPNQPQQQQQAPNTAAFQANFGQFDQQQAHQPQQSGAAFSQQQQTQQQPSFQQGGFASFPQGQQPATPQVGFGSMPQQQQQQTVQQAPQQQGSFAAFNQQPQPSPQGAGFVNFATNQPGATPPNQQQPVLPQSPAPSMQQMMPPPIQQNQVMVPPSQQPHPQQGQVSANFQANFPQSSSQVTGAGAQPSPLPATPQQQQQMPQLMQQQRSSFQASSSASPSAAADAISNMSLSDPKSVASTPPTSSLPAPSSQDKKNSTYKPGQKVYYRSGSTLCSSAEVVKVHLDDDLVPYYTIRVDGKEKQTDDAHLTSKSPLQEEIEAMLATLTIDKLQQVRAYVVQLQGSSGESSSTVTRMTASAVAPQTNVAVNKPDQGVPAATASGGGAAPNVGAPFDVKQQQHQQATPSIAFPTTQNPPPQGSSQASWSALQPSGLGQTGMMAQQMQQQQQQPSAVGQMMTMQPGMVPGQMPQGQVQQGMMPQGQMQQPQQSHIQQQGGAMPQFQMHQQQHGQLQGAAMPQGQMHGSVPPGMQNSGMTAMGGGGGFSGIPSPTASGPQAVPPSSVSTIPAPPIASTPAAPQMHMPQYNAVPGQMQQQMQSQQNVNGSMQHPLSPKGNPFDIY